MKTTIDLGKELAVAVNKITNVFTTKNYLGRLQDQYKEHVECFYDPEVVNEFNQIYKFKKVLSQKSFDNPPYETPLADIDEVADHLREIIENKSAYKSVFKILTKHCNEGFLAAGVCNMIKDLLHILQNDSKNFKEAAVKYERYMGHDLPVSDIIRTITAYGHLSGLVDYYNLEEGLDG